MTEARRSWLFTLAAVIVLLFLTALENAWLLLGAASVLLVSGFMLLPKERARGSLAVLIAASVAVAMAAFLR